VGSGCSLGGLRGVVNFAHELVERRLQPGDDAVDILVMPVDARLGEIVTLNTVFQTPKSTD